MDTNARDHFQKIILEHEEVESILEAQKKKHEQHQTELQQCMELQKYARNHFEKELIEHEKVALILEAKKKDLELQQEQLEQREVNNVNERKMLQSLQHDMEMNKQATLEQNKAGKKVLKLAEDHKKAMGDLHRQIIQLEKKLDAKF